MRAAGELGSTKRAKVVRKDPSLGLLVAGIRLGFFVWKDSRPAVALALVLAGRTSWNLEFSDQQRTRSVLLLHEHRKSMPVKGQKKN